MKIEQVVWHADRWLRTLATRVKFKSLVRRGIVTMGEHSYGCPKVNYWGENCRLVIGKFCSIAEDVEIFLGGNHRVDWLSTYPFPSLTSYFPEASNVIGHPATKGDVIIGNDVWFAKGSIVMSGVTVGDGAVIGARSVVTADVEPYCIVAGNPARFIRRRFDQETVQSLLKIRWWDWPNKKLRENIPLLCSDDLDRFFSSLNTAGRDHM